jgi:hypothetical protein
MPATGCSRNRSSPRSKPVLKLSALSTLACKDSTGLYTSVKIVVEGEVGTWGDDSKRHRNRTAVSTDFFIYKQVRDNNNKKKK